jgi:hypothetical protein
MTWEFFSSYLFGVLKASCTWMTISFSRSRKFSVTVLLMMFTMPSAYTVPPSMSTIRGFGLLILFWRSYVSGSYCFCFFLYLQMHV